MTVSTDKQEVDKKFLWGKFQEGEDDRRRFAKKIAYKAADMAMDDDMNIQANKSGIGTAGALGIAAVAGIPPTLLAAWALMQGRGEAPAAPAPAAAVSVSDSEYEVRFFDADGKPIPVPHISQRGK